MIFISHRGNLNGVISHRENAPDYVDEALKLGFECEVDLRMKDNIPCLGHDTPDHPVTIEWLTERKGGLWVHVKEYSALVWLMENCPNNKFFCHESDKFTLVSNGWVWSHDLDNRMTNKCVIPLLSKESVATYNQNGFGAVCSDFVFECLNKFSK